MKIGEGKAIKETVFLLSSTAQPYQRDALDIVFLPSNVSYRFRYDKKWLSPKLKTANGEIITEKALDLKGKEAIIVHILIENEEGIKNEQINYGVLEYLPLRKARINQVRILGEFLWIGFILGDWITYNKSSENGINEHHEFIKNQVPTNPDILDELVFVKKGVKMSTTPENFEETDDRVLKNWNLIASHVSRYSYEYNERGKYPVMLKLIGVCSADSETTIIPKKIGQNLYGFELTSGESYFCDIAEFCSEGIEPFELELIMAEKSITPTIKTSEVRGKYDVLRFMMSCNSVQKDQLSMIHFQPIGLKERGISRAQLWIKLKSRKWENLILPLIGFGVSTFISSSQFLNLITQQPFNLPLLIASALGTIGSIISLRFLRK